MHFDFYHITMFSLHSSVPSNHTALKLLVLAGEIRICARGNYFLIMLNASNSCWYTHTHTHVPICLISAMRESFAKHAPRIPGFDITRAIWGAWRAMRGAADGLTNGAADNRGYSSATREKIKNIMSVSGPVLWPSFIFGLDSLLLWFQRD